MVIMQLRELDIKTSSNLFGSTFKKKLSKLVYKKF